MTDFFVFRPPRKIGTVFHLAALAFTVGIGGLGLMQASRAEAGLAFLLALLPISIAVLLSPLLAYRTYALWRASYILERDGVHLRWGLRAEDIPISSIQWVQPASTIPGLRLPWPRWPGAVLGERRLPNAIPVEFLAARSDHLIMLATPGRIFALSPADPTAFIHTFQRFSEYGSLAPIPYHSTRPAALLSHYWNNLPARLLWFATLLPSLGLLVWVSLSIPLRSQVALHFTPEGEPGEFVPAVRLMLLPILNTFAVLIDWLVGLFFFRYAESRPLAYLLWSGGVITALLFLGAVAFILTSK